MVSGTLLSSVTKISETQWLQWMLRDPIVPCVVICGADLVRWFDADCIFARLRQCGPADAFQRWCAWSRTTRSQTQQRRRQVTEAVKKEVAARQEWKCRRCGEMLTSCFECDHVEEHAIRGNDATSNLQCLCAQCHRVKTREDRHYADPLLAIAPPEKRGAVHQYEGNDGRIFSAYFYRT